MPRRVLTTLGLVALTVLIAASPVAAGIDSETEVIEIVGSRAGPTLADHWETGLGDAFDRQVDLANSGTVQFRLPLQIIWEWWQNNNP